MTAKQEIEALKAQVKVLQEQVKALAARPYCGCGYASYPYTVTWTTTGGSTWGNSDGPVSDS